MMNQLSFKVSYAFFTFVDLLSEENEYDIKIPKEKNNQIYSP
jgi:hypothetical protein